MDTHCDWCGRPASIRRYRTLYADTEFEQTSSYLECEECSALATEVVAGKYVILCTFPDDDADYCKMFVVETEWLKGYCCSLEEFLDNYVWDETWSVYLQAKAQNKVITEWPQK